MSRAWVWHRSWSHKYSNLLLKLPALESRFCSSSRTLAWRSRWRSALTCSSPVRSCSLAPVPIFERILEYVKRTSAKTSKADSLNGGSESTRASRTPRARFTFHGNVRDTRYGWLRLTPAYSVHLVRELLESRTLPELPVLDPFCGTGT